MELINEIINNKKNKQPLPSSFKLHGRTISDPIEIANGFCKYSTIGPTLANKISSTTCSFQNFLGPSINKTIFLKPTTVIEASHINLEKLLVLIIFQ